MMPTDPVRYDRSVETPAEDEAETIDGLEASFARILDTTSQDYGRGVRGVHAKAHGIVRGMLTVRDGLPAMFAQGLFAAPVVHEAILRFSTNPGDILDDSIAVPRGVALKVLEVVGERLPGSDGDTTQDFIMINAPVFSAATPKAFGKTLSLLAATTDRAEGAKKLASTVLRGAEAALEAIGQQSSTLVTLGGAQQVHPLGETYYSQTPFRYGDHIAKFALFPVSPALTRLSGKVVDIDGRADALREEMRGVLSDSGGRWELRVQLNTDLAAMPIEDPTVRWDEAQSPFVTVATIDVEPQAGWAGEDSRPIDEALAFNVWHGLAAHQPLGGINRARNAPYRFSAEYRGRVNGCPIHEPTSLADLPAVS